MKILRIVSFLFIVASISCKSIAQENIDKIYITELVGKISKSYLDNYAIPDKGKEVSSFLLNNLKEGKYDNIASYDSLAVTLKRDIYKITNDKHTQIIYKLTKKDPKSGDTNQPQSPAEFFKTIENYGFTKIEIKDGNIGYVKMPVFFPIQMDAKAKDAADAMMKKFENCQSIIFDLTGCRGGDPNMISYLISYLYPKDKKIHLNSFFYRPNESTMDSFTQSINGEPLVDVNVYVLTSNKTFSAGEEFSYDLKHLKRATLVGEVTGGGAHAVEPRVIDDKFNMMLPTGRAINPITKTNWEGVGVKPHVEIEAEKALEKTLNLIRS